MGDVVKRLEKIIEDAEAVPTKADMAKIGPRVLGDKGKRTLSPWSQGSAVHSAIETFISRLEDPIARSKLEELRKATREVLGVHAVDSLSGVFNPVKLYRILRNSEMDVRDASATVVVNANTRAEFKMDEKRRTIVSKGACVLCVLYFV